MVCKLLLGVPGDGSDLYLVPCVVLSPDSAHGRWNSGKIGPNCAPSSADSPNVSAKQSGDY